MNESQNPWTILDKREIYDNNWINLTEYNVINPSGGKGIYGKVHFKNYAIGIVPIDDEGNIYLIGQYRFPLNQYSWEIPEGGGPLQVPPLESAKRELLEETGIKAAKWTKILDLHLSNSVTDECSYVYLAQELSFHTAMPEETEELALKKVSLDEAYQMVISGQITDSISVAAILRVRLMY